MRSGLLGIQRQEDVLHPRIGAQELLHSRILERLHELLDVVGIRVVRADRELTGELVGRVGKTIECTPIVVEGVMYVTTGYLRVVALDTGNGKELWQFNPLKDHPFPHRLASGGVNRGCAYWSDGKPNGERRIIHGTSDGRLFSLDARTGKLDPKIHELIALAVAVTTRCDGCIARHAKTAVELGVTKEEIAEALGTAIALNAGAALTYSARVFDALEALPTND